MNSIYNEDNSIIVFILTAAMQKAFLVSETIKQLLGCDFRKPTIEPHITVN